MLLIFPKAPSENQSGVGISHMVVQVSIVATMEHRIAVALVKRYQIETSVKTASCIHPCLSKFTIWSSRSLLISCLELRFHAGSVRRSKLGSDVTSQ
jgi:hypothetical protein